MLQLVLLLNWCFGNKNLLLLLCLRGLGSLQDLQLGLAARRCDLPSLSKFVQALLNKGTGPRHLLDISRWEAYCMTRLLDIVTVANHAAAHGNFIIQCQASWSILLRLLLFLNDR